MRPLDNARLVAQLCGLERRTMRTTGRDLIDHPPGGMDDLANACAGAVALVLRKDPRARIPIVKF